MALQTLTTRRGTTYVHDDTDIMLEDDCMYVTIGALDSTSAIILGDREWPAFIEMILAIDAKRKEAGDGTA